MLNGAHTTHAVTFNPTATLMILHKIFHLSMSPEQSRQRLANVEAYRDALPGVARAEFPGHGISHWLLRLAPGLQARLVLSEMPSEINEGYIFKSLDGSAEVFGAVTFHAIKSNLTEVELMVNYEFHSLTLRLLDRVFGFGERFLVSQLRSVRARFEGTAVRAHAGGMMAAHGMTAATT